MSENYLKAKTRDLLGRKVKKLRTEGVIPANLYGKKIKSQALVLNSDEFRKVFKQVGETGIVILKIEGGKEDHPVLIKNIQIHPVSEKILHVDLRQIILTEKIKSQIPIELTGESPATTQKIGIMIQVTSEVEVEALPANLPEKFTVDISKLANVGDQILVKDLDVDKSKVEIQSDGNLVVAKIDQLAEEVVVAPKVTEEVVEAVPGETPVENQEQETKKEEPPAKE